MAGKNRGRRRASMCGPNVTSRPGRIRNDTHRNRRGRFARLGSAETIRYTPNRRRTGRFCPK